MEEQVLNQICVGFEGQIFPLWIYSQNLIFVKILTTKPEKVVRFSNKTEVCYRNTFFKIPFHFFKNKVLVVPRLRKKLEDNPEKKDEEKAYEKKDENKDEKKDEETKITKRGTRYAKCLSLNSKKFKNGFFNF